MRALPLETAQPVSKEVKLKSKKLIRSLILPVGVFVCVAPAVLGVIASRTSLKREGGLNERPQAGPIIRTDKEGYLAGETITISGEGFSPLESVMLRVSHADGTV